MISQFWKIAPSIQKYWHFARKEEFCYCFNLTSIKHLNFLINIFAILVVIEPLHNEGVILQTSPSSSSSSSLITIIIIIIINTIIIVIIIIIAVPLHYKYSCSSLASRFHCLYVILTVHGTQAKHGYDFVIFRPFFIGQNHNLSQSLASVDGFWEEKSLISKFFIFIFFYDKNSF